MINCNPGLEIHITGIDILIIYKCPSFLFQIWRLYQMAWKKWTQDGWIGQILYHMIKKLSKWKLYWEIYISLRITVITRFGNSNLIVHFWNFLFFLFLFWKFWILQILLFFSKNWAKDGWILQILYHMIKELVNENCSKNFI